MAAGAGRARLRLLLDEMYPGAIAEALRGRGVDAVAVVERPELRGAPDAEQSATAQQERRALVTENVADFARIANDYDGRAQAHHGLVLVHPERHPRGRTRTVGAMVTALEKLTAQHPADQPTGRRDWLG